MFKKKQPKIKSITMCAVGDLVFTIGLGRDGKCYSWNAMTGQWQIYGPAQEQADAS